MDGTQADIARVPSIAVLLQCDGCVAESALFVTTTTFCGLFKFLSW